jgi:Ni,Fe-hydrogenase I small subunit
MSVASGQLKQLSSEQLRAISSRDKEATLLWIECGSCNGESMAILGAEGPGKTGDNLSDFLTGEQVRLLWHPSLSETTPKEAAEIIDRILAGEEELTILCVEGSIINGPHGTGMYDTFDGRPKRDIIRELCAQAEYVIAMGACAAFGGIPAAAPNPTESCGLQFTNEQPGGLLVPGWRSKAGLPAINISGCPADAKTMIKTMSMTLGGAPLELDKFNRPATVGPCLSDGANKRCGTAEKVGYSCVGCIGAKFPLNKPLFRQIERPKKEPQALPQYENVIFASRPTVRRGWRIGEWLGKLSRWI